jgi:prophage regulatory protein
MRYQVMRLAEVVEYTRLSRSTIYRLMVTDEFPKQIKLASHASGWLLADIDQWLETRQRISHASSNL